MNEFTKKDDTVLNALKSFKTRLEGMTPAEVRQMVKDANITEEEAKSVAAIERALLRESDEVLVDVVHNEDGTMDVVSNKATYKNCWFSEQILEPSDDQSGIVQTYTFTAKPIEEA